MYESPILINNLKENIDFSIQDYCILKKDN